MDLHAAADDKSAQQKSDRTLDGHIVALVEPVCCVHSTYHQASETCGTSVGYI